MEKRDGAVPDQGRPTQRHPQVMLVYATEESGGGLSGSMLVTIVSITSVHTRTANLAA